MLLIILVPDDELFELQDTASIIQDITDPTAYSIQEVKIKAEKDREIEESEKKKSVSYYLFNQ